MNPFIVFLLSLYVPSSASQEAGGQQSQPILLDKSGGFQIGGKTISDPNFPNATLSCDHGSME